MKLARSLFVFGMACLLVLGQASADRLQGIERKLQQMGHQFETLRGENQHLRRKVNILQENNDNQEKIIMRLEDTTTRLEDTITKQGDIITKLQEGSHKQQEIIDELQTATQTIQPSRLQGNITGNIAGGFVAFRVARTSDLDVGSNTVIVYSAVSFNYGGGYSASTGAFTTPVAGIYLFTTIHREVGFVTYITLNNVNKLNTAGAEQSGHEANPSMSSSLLLQLGVGDTVEVVLSGDLGVTKIQCNGDNDCQFSGVLLQEIL